MAEVGLRQRVGEESCCVCPDHAGDRVLDVRSAHPDQMMFVCPVDQQVRRRMIAPWRQPDWLRLTQPELLSYQGLRPLFHIDRSEFGADIPSIFRPFENALFLAGDAVDGEIE